MHRVLILGGGFGGVAAAHVLRERLAPGDEIIVADRKPHFMMGFRKSWGFVGQSPLAVGQAPLAALEQFGIRFVQGEITRIDPANRATEIDGQRIEADAMIVALGAQLAPEAIPGFTEHAHNIYDPAGIEAAAAALQAVTSDDRVVFGIFGVPYKCPPAPYEMAILAREALSARDVNANGVNAAITVFSPQPMSLPIIGEVGCSVLDSRLSEYGITFLPNHKSVGVEAGRVLIEDGSTLAFDVLFAVPPHRAPDVLKAANLTGESGWVKANPHTFETGFADVFAVGDCIAYPMANGQTLPKAGVFAEAEGRIAAEQIAARLMGHAAPPPFDGQGYCFLEVGRDEAMLVTGSFLAQPGPQVKLTDPSVEYMMQKRAFESQHLQEWFGMAMVG
jgi:sulfide:quinone oxidoreductase